MSRSCFAVFLFAVLFFAHPCFADGCFIGKGKISPTANQIAVSRDADITEPNQNAFIAFKDGKEHLIIQVKYRGKLSEFLWLVPTPSKPTVKRFKNALFEELHQITAPPIKYWFDADKNIRFFDRYTSGKKSGAMAAKPGLGMGGAGGMELEVDVIKKERIGIYDTVILKSTNARDLRSWLNANGYPIKDTAVPILEDYLKRGWVFTAMRVNLNSARSGWKDQQEGLLEPLQFTFTTKKPIYPLKISSLNPGKSEVLLYIAAENFIISSQLKTESTFHDYRVKSLAYIYSRNPKELLKQNAIAVDMNKWTTRKLTKLRGTFMSSEMTHDVVLNKSSIYVPPTPISPPVLDNIGMLSLFYLLAMLSYPGSMIIPSILALYCSRNSAGKQRKRLYAIAAIGPVCICLVRIVMDYGNHFNYYFSLEHIKSVLYGINSSLAIQNGSGYTNTTPLFIFPTVIFMTLLLVLTWICLEVEQNKQNTRLLKFGGMYAILAGLYFFSFIQSGIVMCIEKSESYSNVGIAAITLLVILPAIAAIKYITKRKIILQNSGADNV